MNKLYCDQTGGNKLSVTAPIMPNNILGMETMEGLIELDIINLNLKIKYENSKKLSW